MRLFAVTLLTMLAITAVVTFFALCLFGAFWLVWALVQVVGPHS